MVEHFELQWNRIRDPELSPSHRDALEQCIEAVCVSWENTPWRAGQQKKGSGVDCVRYVVAVLDELRGGSTLIPRVAQDAAWHNKDHVASALHELLRAFEPYSSIESNEVEPGDVVICGPVGGGPAHISIVGGKRNHMWHAISRGVCQCGMTVWAPFELKRIYRPLHKKEWECFF